MDPKEFQAFLTKLTSPIATAASGQVTLGTATQSSPPPTAAATSTAAAPPPAAASVDSTMPPPAALPSASIHISVLTSPAPRGMVARTLVRIRRARRLGASDSTPLRAMIVTRVSSSLQVAPPDDDDAEEEEEEENDDADQFDEARAAPSPAPSSSPYRYGIATPSPPSRARAAAAASEDDESGDDEYKATASARRPRRLRARPTPKRHHDEMDESESSGDDEPQSARAAVATEGEYNDAQSAADDDGGDGADSQMEHASESTNPNMSKRKKEFSRIQLNRSGCRSFNEFLRRIEFRTDDLHDLTPDEFLSVLPRWVAESRMGNGTPYVWATIKGYINSLQRVVRTFEPSSEWGHLTLKDIPAVRDAINELRSREPQDTKTSGTPTQAGSAATTPTVGTGGGEMTTRRAQRIANGEVLPPRESYNYNYSPPSSAPNSPRQSGQSGVDFDQSGSASVGASASAGVGRGRTSSVQKLSPEQESYMLAQLDPQHPEGLFRLAFINVARYFGVHYTEEHRSLTIRNMLRGSKVVRVRFEGGIKPRREVDPALVHADSAAASAAESSSSSTPAAAAPAGEAMDTSASSDSNVAAAAAATASEPAVSDVPAASVAAASDPSAAATAAPSTATATAADTGAPEADAVYADDETPFEVVDQSDTSPSVCWRRVRFVAFVPSPGSKRPISFMYERPWEGALCPVRIYESFLSHRPPVLTEQTPGLTAADVELSYVLWLKCKKHFGPFELEWFLLAQIGRNKVSSLISTLATGLGFAAGFCNSSITHAPKRAIVLSAEELEALREENALHLYGVPTREENAVTQQALMLAAAAEQTNANDGGGGRVQEQEAPAHVSFQAPPVPSRPQRTKPDSAARSSSVSAVPPMQFDFSALLQQHSQPQQQQQQQQQPSYPPMAPFLPFMQSPNGQPSFPSSHRSFFPSQLDPSSDHMERNRQALQQIDGANQRQQQQRQQQNSDVAPLLSPDHLAAPGIALAQASSTVLSPFSFPPLMPHGSTAPRLPVAAPSMALAPASVESVPSLLLFIDKFQTQLSTLSSYAAECQKSLDALRGMSAQLKVEASAALKVQQQAAKIAEQFQQIEEQKFIIEQLRREKSGATKLNDGAAAAQPSGAAEASTVSPARVADPPSLQVDQGVIDAPVTALAAAAAPSQLVPTADTKQIDLQSNSADAGGDERKEDAQSSAMQVDGEDDDDLPPLVTADAPLPSSADVAVTPATDDTQAAAAAAASSSLTPTKHSASTRFHDQDTTLLQ